MNFTLQVLTTNYNRYSHGFHLTNTYINGVNFSTTHKGFYKQATRKIVNVNCETFFIVLLEYGFNSC